MIGPSAPEPTGHAPQGLRLRWCDGRPFLTGLATGGGFDMVNIDELKNDQENGAV
jgi:hypothetical protein